jgi:hypothetical protein
VMHSADMVQMIALAPEGPYALPPGHGNQSQERVTSQKAGADGGGVHLVQVVKALAGVDLEEGRARHHGEQASVSRSR